MIWPDEGYLIARGLVPHDARAAYCRLWEREAPSLSGWPDCVPYMRYAVVRDLLLCPQIVGSVEDILGEPVGLHLVLSGWVSTERQWHQDFYLNPPFVGDAYCGIWLALGDIVADSGPLEVIPGSHNWEPLTQEECLARLDPDERSDPNWPKLAERFVTDHWEKRIAEEGAEPVQFLGEGGDALFWHPRVVHRGSPPRVPGTLRPAVIAHYSALRVRDDMPVRATHGAGTYFVLG